jgi:leukotriene-A4 hydrolase
MSGTKVIEFKNWQNLSFTEVKKGFGNLVHSPNSDNLAHSLDQRYRISTFLCKFAKVKSIIPALLLSGLFFSACKKEMKVKNHTYGNYDEVRISHISLDLLVDFEKKSMAGSATLDIENLTGAEQVILDHKNMDIQYAAVDGAEVAFQIGPFDSILGSALIIPIKKESKKVLVKYKTHADAEALQWLSPEQTNDKKYPFLFSQSQAILARTWIPLMDAPAIRFTYDARIQVPKHLMAVMSAANPTVKNAEGVYHFKQDKPIPSYLMAIAAGDMQFQTLGRNTGVYAEPGMLEKSAWEFADMQSMVDSAEALYGPYAWGRCDVLVLPPSFPFGGMENPVLTFATPTIIAGDRSLVSLVAHELAHSWSGNLVTNETWNDFWLNEGFTVYFEQRIMEKIYGFDYAEMLTALSRGELQHSVDNMMADPNSKNDTRLFLDLEGRSPDDGVTDIAYEKGRFFLRSIEKVVGRENWDKFLVDYFKTNAFRTMTTDRFIQYLETNLLSKNEAWKKQVNYKEWIFETGLPANCGNIQSKELAKVDEAIKAYSKGYDVDVVDTTGYTTHHWLYFLRNLPVLNAAQMKSLDNRFAFTQSGNAEILCDWFVLSSRYQYTDAYDAMRGFLSSVGRRKFLSPIYRELIKTPKGKEMALDIFKQAEKGYHAVAARTLRDMLGI